MGDRRKMRTGDRVNGAVILVVGLFLGLAIDGMIRLVGTGFWPVAVIILILFRGVFLFELAIEGLFNRIVPSGIKPASQPKAKERKPLVLLLSLPAGIAIGMILSRLGLSETLLSVI
jgi:hypothetical protein